MRNADASGDVFGSPIASVMRPSECRSSSGIAGRLKVRFLCSFERAGSRDHTCIPRPMSGAAAHRPPACAVRAGIITVEILGTLHQGRSAICPATPVFIVLGTGLGARPEIVERSMAWNPEGEPQIIDRPQRQPRKRLPGRPQDTELRRRFTRRRRPIRRVNHLQRKLKEKTHSRGTPGLTSV